MWHMLKISVFLFIIGIGFNFSGINGLVFPFNTQDEGNERDSSIKSNNVNEYPKIKVNPSIGSKMFEGALSQSHDPIIIRSNSDFEKLGFKGIGTLNDPYLIEGLNLTSMAERLIDIQNTDVYFEIRNNRLDGLTAGLHGIFLANITHATIRGNVIKNSVHNGILMGRGGDIWIMDNWIFQHGSNGIQVHDSDNFEINGNIIYNNRNVGIWLRDNVIEEGTITNNTIRDNNRYGLLLGWEIANETSLVVDNFITENTFIRNSGEGMSQAGDYGETFGEIGNTFASNYWDDYDLSEPILRPYDIDGSVSNSDPSPHVNPPTKHIISAPMLLDPIGDENLNGLVRVQWIPALDSLNNNPIRYSIALSYDHGEKWEILESNLTQTVYEWDTDNYPEGTVVLLKIIAENNDKTVLSESILSEPMIIRKPFWWDILRDLEQSGLLQIIGLLILASITGLLGWFWFRVKTRSRSGFEGWVSSFDENYLRKIYHKLIIGLEYAKTELLSQVEQLPDITTSEYAVIGNIFPKDIKYDLKSHFKGRTILILIEIAYQPLPKSNITFLSKVFKIPNQTTSDEIKRLLTMDYIQPRVSSLTLLDSRKKNYSLTHKGLVLLHLLKESLTNTFTKMNWEEIYG